MPKTSEAEISIYTGSFCQEKSIFAWNFFRKTMCESDLPSVFWWNMNRQLHACDEAD
jgi:hypothetical protein